MSSLRKCTYNVPTLYMTKTLKSSSTICDILDDSSLIVFVKNLI